MPCAIFPTELAAAATPLKPQNPESQLECRAPCFPQNWQLLRRGVAINSGANLLSSDTIAPPLDQKYKFASYWPQ